MLNFDLKNEAEARLRAANDEYQTLASEVAKRATELYEKRKATAMQVIKACKEYVNILANSPKEFDKTISEFKVEFHKFNEVIQRIQYEAEKAVRESGGVAGGGVAMGVGVAAFGPTAAMAIATTFGTASTGTAISALSGAAAANAALAWLGGGAAIAGGGGMAAGEALLALAGPIGWSIGAVGLGVGALMMNGKNKEIAIEANMQAAKIRKKTASLRLAKEEIARLMTLTSQHADGVMNRLNFLKREAPNNYQHFSNEHKQELTALINNIQALSKLLNKTLT